MKKILSLILVIALVAGIAVTGTMAYLTDRDNETNVFTVGDVDIELSESKSSFIHTLSKGFLYAAVFAPYTVDVTPSFSYVM